MANESKKRLALAIIDFLTNCTRDGTVSPDDHESLEVASQCIADAFKVDPTDKAALTDALAGQSLITIYGVFEKMKSKSTPAAGASSSPSSAPNTTTPPKPAGPSEADKAAAEALKTQGNAAMSKKDYKSAIDLYTQALALNPLNPIYLSNRAAAHSSSGNYDAAIADAQVAVDTDPKYTKAWSRLGLARFAKGDARGSMEAYKAGIDAEGNGGSDIMRRGYETAKRRVEEEEGADDDDSAPATRGGAGGMPDLGGLASMLGGGGAGGGGMPDLSSIMSNPMFSQMAQSLMSNPQLMQGLMNNPRLRDMMESVNGGGGGAGGAGSPGGMPDLSALMSDPSIAEMARNFMGGGAGGGTGGAGRGAGGTPPSS